MQEAYDYSYSKLYIFQIEEYSIDEDLPRHMLIINNKTFTGETDSREGSEFDVAKLTSTFGRRGYIVHDMQDLSARVRTTNFLDYI